ncbi:hypothetical protein Bca4012_030339 [Brassica carinata]|uniref:Uncharacterized protein n=1 Tax=Brassica carinata TaxID=52824 RepID=A0A8X7RNH0_BRACI|nr:hypothetical protein Bca52824_048348 [Brassica carinata]
MTGTDAIDAVAQLPVSHSDTNSQSEVSPPGTIVIAEQSADPALACNEDLFSQHESSSKGLPPSPSATLPVESEIAEDFISSGTLTIVANADANEVYGSDASDGFNKGNAETVERYRALLRLSNEHRLSEIEWHQAASKANSIASQIELLEEIIKAKGKFDFTAELEKLKEELMEADGMLADVKVKVPDWCKLEERWLLDE